MDSIQQGAKERVSMSKTLILTIRTPDHIPRHTFKMTRATPGSYHYAFGHGIIPASVSFFLKSAIKKKLEPVLLISESASNKEEIIEIAEKLGVEYHV